MKINTFLIKNYMKTNKLNVVKFCKLANISIYLYYKIMRGDINFGVSVLKRIVDVLGIHLHEIFI